MKNIYLLIGESGVGKSTIADILDERYGLKQLKSYTTRPKRDHKDTSHIFISQEEYNQLQNVVAYTEYCGYRYCATSEQIIQSDLFIIDPSGFEYFKRNYSGNKQYRLIYVHAPERVRKMRMYSRGDDKLHVGERLAYDRQAFQGISNLADKHIYNRDLEDCLQAVKKYIDECESKQRQF